MMSHQGRNAIWMGLLVALLLVPTFAQALETIRVQGQDSIDLTSSLEGMYDPTGQSGLAEISRSNQFTRPESGKPSFGFGAGNVWGRVRIDATGASRPQRWCFVWNLTFIDSADVYVVGDDGAELAHEKMGMFEGLPRDQAMYYSVDLTPYADRPFILYISNSSRYSLRLDSLLMSEKAKGLFEASANRSNSFLAGALAVTASLFFGIGIVFQSRIHIWGGMVALLLTWIILMVSGLNRPLGLTFSPGDDWRMAQIPIMTVNVVLPLFIAAFCDTALNSPRLYAGIRVGALVVLLGEAAAVLYWPYQALSAGFVGFCLACFAMLILVLGDRQVDRYDRGAVIASMTPFMVLTILHLVAFNNLAPNILPFRGLFQHFLDLAFGALVAGFILATVFRSKNRLERVITQRTAQLAQAKQAAETSLESETQARQRLHTFIQMATHEFKTPLSVIDGAAQVLELLVDSHNRDITSRLSAIRQSVTRVVDLVNVCLKGERYETLSPSFAPLSVPQMLQKGVERNNITDSAPVTLSVTDLPEQWLGDAGLLGIALDALVDNARRYAGGDLPIEIQASMADNAIHISVCDRGQGVAVADGDKIFDKYYRGKHSSGIPGTGIGLHLVKTVAELHNGQAKYAPRPGGGAVFTLVLPLMR